MRDRTEEEALASIKKFNDTGVLPRDWDVTVRKGKRVTYWGYVNNRRNGIEPSCNSENRSIPDTKPSGTNRGATFAVWRELEYPKMHPRDQHLYTLRYECRFSNKYVAMRLRMPVRSVENRLRYIRSRIATYIGVTMQ